MTHTHTWKGLCSHVSEKPHLRYITTFYSENKSNQYSWVTDKHYCISNNLCTISLRIWAYMHCTPINILQLCISLASDCFSLLGYPIDDHLYSSARQNLHTKYWLLDNHQHTECIPTVAQNMPANRYTMYQATSIHMHTNQLTSWWPADLPVPGVSSPEGSQGRVGKLFWRLDWVDTTTVNRYPAVEEGTELQQLHVNSVKGYGYIHKLYHIYRKMMQVHYRVCAHPHSCTLMIEYLYFQCTYTKGKLIYRTLEKVHVNAASLTILENSSHAGQG